MPKYKQMKHGSLFSGIGGFDLAAEWMGWENVFHCEWNEFGQKILQYYWPNAIKYNDITQTDFTIHRGCIDILTGGFPCQPYSMAGQRKGKEDERHLWPEMLRAIREIQPRWVVGENVLGLVNWNGGMVFHEVQADLEAAGYEVWPYVLPAVSVGAPHRRDRVWFVAHSNLRRGCREKGVGQYDLRGSKGKESYNNIIKTDKRLEQWENARPTPHPNRNGLNQRNGNDEEQPGERGVDAQRDVEQGNEYGDAADTDRRPTGTSGESCGIERGGCENDDEQSQRGREAQQHTGCADVSRDAADAMLPRGGKDNRRGESKFFDQNGEIGNWQNFPTQSPVCGGDDGLPTKLDGITFSKWRNESIKGYGNAIVPQVVYQIFKAIEEYESVKNTHGSRNFKP
jgi:DNA (cytosine-5)-methyltransferase 1